MRGSRGTSRVSARARTRPFAAAGTLVFLAAACADRSGSGGATWIGLAGRFEPAGVEDGSAWIEDVLPRRSWEAGPIPGSWWTALPEEGGPSKTKSLDVRLRAGERELSRKDVAVPHLAELDPGSFTVAGGEVHLVLEPGEEPPEEIVCSVRLPFGRLHEGAWRMEIDDFSADAIPGLPGRAVELVLDVPPRSALRFFALGKALQGQTAELAWRILLDGEEIASEEMRAERRAGGSWMTVALPAQGGSGARLEFVAEEGPGLVAWMAPTIGPADAPGYARRSEARPNVVLFVVDTFRADNLAAYGGDPDLMPELNALVEESVAFRRCWTTAPWTLPSHASMLTGVYPPEHGTEEPDVRLSDDLTTLAEQLAAHGYRTGAVTDSGFVSRVFGLDQGFEWFREIKDSHLSKTFGSATGFLQADDGRPAFLFVHTFRVHTPYRVGAEEDDTRYQEIREERLIDDPQTEDPEVRAELLALYRRGAADLDAALAPWLAELRALGVFENGYLVLTSDHGEAFGEHGQLFHGRTVPWEEEVRIPLVIHGGDLAPGLEDVPTSLVDVPRTIAGLAGVPPAPLWGGLALLEDPGERAVLTYSGKRVAVIEGSRKVMGLSLRGPNRRFILGGVYDLASDPGETTDLAPAEGEEKRRLVDEAVRWVELTSTPLVDATAAELSSEDRSHLQALGYAAEE